MDFKTLSAETAKIEGENYDPRFVIVKDGEGVPHKLANLDHESWMPKTGRVEIDALRKSTRHKNQTSIKCVNDKMHGCRIGIPLNIDRDTKEIRFLSIVMGDFEYFDLSDKMQRYRAIVVTNSEYVEGSPNLHGTPKYKLIDKEREAVRYIESMNVKKKAREIVENLDIAQLREMAAPLGIDEKANSDAMIRAALYKKVEDQPHKFMEVWNNPRKKALTVFKGLFQKSLIGFSNEHNTFMYNNLPLGRTEDEAIDFINDKPSLLLSMEKDFKEKITRPAVKETAGSNSNAALEAEIERLKKQLETKNSGEQSTEELNAPPALGDKSEHEKLKEEAKEMGIKGYGILSEEKLREKIAAQKLEESRS